MTQNDGLKIGKITTWQAGSGVGKKQSETDTCTLKAFSLEADSQ